MIIRSKRVWFLVMLYYIDFTYTIIVYCTGFCRIMNEVIRIAKPHPRRGIPATLVTPIRQSAVYYAISLVQCELSHNDRVRRHLSIKHNL